jgi:hypothetical protein
LGRAACARCCFWCMYITRVQPATCRIETEAMLSLCYLCAISAIYGRNCPVSYSPRFAWGGRPHRRFISVRERG